MGALKDILRAFFPAGDFTQSDNGEEALPTQIVILYTVTVPYTTVSEFFLFFPERNIEDCETRGKTL